MPIGSGSFDGAQGGDVGRVRGTATAIVLALGLVASACSGDDDDGASGSEAPATEVPASSEAPATTVSNATTAPPETTLGWTTVRSGPIDGFDITLRFAATLPAAASRHPL